MQIAQGQHQAVQAAQELLHIYTTVNVGKIAQAVLIQAQRILVQVTLLEIEK